MILQGGSAEAVTIFGAADRRDSEGGEAGVAVKELCRKHGISDATFYNWKAKYGGLGVSELKWLRELRSGDTPSTRDKITMETYSSAK